MGLEMVTRKPPLVLLTAYNGAAYLTAQLSSLCAQVVSFTAILRDDGSADDTPALLAAQCHQDARFRLSSTSGVHLGAVGGFFALMREAADSGAPVALCDQDDIWHPDKLTRLQAALSEAEACFGADTPILVHSDARIVDADGRPLHSSLWRHQGWNPAAQSLPELLVQNNVTGCLLMMNAPLCRLCAAHQPTGDLHMHDWFIALTAAAFGRIIPIPAALADYRQHGTNAMGASTSGLFRRSLTALRTPDRIRARIALSYRNAAQFQQAYGDLLPKEAQKVLADFAQIPKMRKIARERALRKGGFRMQSKAARAGMMLFG